MGITSTTIKVRNVSQGGEPVELLAKVDTGALLLVLPGAIAEQLNLPVIRKQYVKYANEERAERDIVYNVETEVCGRKGVFEAVVEPKKQYALLGAIVMETLDLIVEPRGLQLYPNPRSQDLPVADIEESAPNSEAGGPLGPLTSSKRTHCG